MIRLYTRSGGLLAGRWLVAGLTLLLLAGCSGLGVAHGTGTATGSGAAVGTGTGTVNGQPASGPVAGGTGTVTGTGTVVGRGTVTEGTATPELPSGFLLALGLLTAFLVAAPIWWLRHRGQRSDPA